MCHVGSQGMPLEQLADGAMRISNFCDDIDAYCGEKKITSIDIGGGLSVNYDSDQVTPSFKTYRDAILAKLPTFFENNKRRTIITEFGKSIVSKSGIVVAKVEV